jgi:hypothetical protein
MCGAHHPRPMGDMPQLVGLVTQWYNGTHYGPAFAFWTDLGYNMGCIPHWYGVKPPFTPLLRCRREVPIVRKSNRREFQTSF